MGGFNSIRGDETVGYADNFSFDGTERGGKMVADGQLWIGSTASRHVRLNTLTGGTGVTITNGSGSITIAVNGSVVGQTITGDTGGALSPTGGNWNILGQKAGSVPVMITTGSGSTLSVEDRTWTTSLVVDPSATVGLRGTYQTITAALAAAVAGQTIFVRPGTYTENITLVAGVDLQAYESSGYSRSTVISGTITASFAGRCTISGFELTSVNANTVAVTGASQTNLIIKNCFLFQNGNAGSNYAIASNSSGGAITYVFDCFGNLGANGAYVSNSGGSVNFQNCFFRDDGGTSVVNSCTSSTTTRFVDCVVQNRFSVNGATLILQGCQISVNTKAAVALALVTGGVCISEYTIYGGATDQTVITIDATSRFEGIHTELDVDANVSGTIMTNAGTLTYDIISQRDNAGGPGKGTLPAPTTTAYTNFGCARFRQGQLVNVTTPGGYPYTTLTSDYVILVDSSAARGISLIASPVTGQTYRIKDNVGSATANNITITPAAGNIDGAATLVISTNYGAVDLVYNGTQWNVL